MTQFSIHLIILAMASWRLTEFFLYDAGPFGVFEKIRSFVGANEDEPEGFFAELFSCPSCMSVWASGGVLMTYYVVPASVYVFALLALSTAVLAINVWMDRSDG